LMLFQKNLLSILFIIVVIKFI